MSARPDGEEGARHAGHEGGGISAPAFVGREAEAAAVTRALADPPARVLIEGEAGIGKSRLVHECLHLPSLDRQRTLDATCPPLPDPYPLGPVVDGLHRLGPRVAGLQLSPLGGALRPLFPEWADDLPPAPEPLEDPRATRHRLLRAVIELVERLEVEVLLIEDAQWADTTTLELLLMLYDSPDLSIVVTYRPTELPSGSLLARFAARSSTRFGHVRVALEALTVQDTRDVVASMLTTEQVSSEFASFLHERTAGVPLAVEESVSLLWDRGDIVRSGGEWTRRSVDRLQVPPTVRDSVLERVQRLDPTAQQLLAAAAVFADPVDQATLRQVARLDEAAARQGLAGALRSGLLRETAPGRHMLRHPLAARAVADALPVSERRRLHRRAAEALEQLGVAPAARLSWHYREAGEVAAWRHHAEAAAEAALASGDDRAAVLLLQQLVSNALHEPDVAVRLARRLGEAAAWGAAALGTLGTEVANTLVEVLAGDTPVEARGEIRLLLGRLLLQLGEFERAAEQIEVAVAEVDGRSALATRAMVSLAFPRGHAWPAARHLEWLARATRLFPQAPADQRVGLAVDRASALLLLGEEAGWRAAAELDIDVDVATPFERRQIARGLMNVGHMAIAWGRHDEARRRLDAAIALMEATDYRRLLNSARLTRLHLDWHIGAWTGLAGRVTELADTDDTLPEARLEARLILGLIALVQRDRAEAEQQLAAVLDEATRRGLVDAQMEPAAALGRLRLAENAPEEALEVTGPGIATLTKMDVWLWATDIVSVHVDAMARAERVDEAGDLVARFRAGLDGRRAPAPAAGLEMSEAILAEARGDRAQAADGFARAAATWSALPRPYDELLALERRGTCLLAGGADDQGLQLLTSVQRRMQELGALWDADRVARRLRQHGVDVARVWRGGRRGYGDQLSPREREVSQLVAQGLTNRQVAAALFLSPRTIDRHLSSAMRKLGVSSRTALAVAVAHPATGQPGGDESKIG